MEPSAEQHSLTTHLWGVFDVLRGELNIDALVQAGLYLLCFKRLCNVWDEHQGADPIGVIVPDGCHWKDAWLDKEVEPALTGIEQANEGRLGGVFTSSRLSSISSSSLRRAMNQIDLIPLGTNDVSTEEFAAIFEETLQQFMEQHGRKQPGLEGYTPRSLIALMMALSQPKAGMRVYDPCAGTGGGLLSAARLVDEHGGDPAGLTLYGQEINHRVWALGRLNLLLHGLDPSLLVCGDTLFSPLHIEDDRPMRFDVVCGVPPMNLRYPRDKPVNYPERFEVDGDQLGPARHGFVQHMLSSLSADGMACIAVPQSILFEGGRTAKKLRRQWLEKDWLEAVVGLGSRLLHNTGIPLSILVFRLQKPPSRQGKVLFVNADRKYESASSTLNKLTAQNIKDVVGTYQKFKTEDGVSAVVENAELLDVDALTVRRFANPEQVAWNKFLAETGVEQRTIGDLFALNKKFQKGASVDPEGVLYLQNTGTFVAQLEEPTGRKTQRWIQLIPHTNNRPARPLVRYVCRFLNSPEGKQALQSIVGVGTTLLSLRRDQLAQFQIPLPPMEFMVQQDAIFEKIQKLRTLIDVVEVNAQKLPDGPDMAEGDLEPFSTKEIFERQVERLPYLVAPPLRAALASVDPKEKKEHLVRFFQSVSSVLVLIQLTVLSEVYEQSHEDGKAALGEDLKKNGLRIGPLKHSDIGVWAFVHRACATVFESADPKKLQFDAKLVELMELVSQDELKSLLSEMGDKKNRWISHGGAYGPKEIGQQAVFLENRMEESLAPLIKLFRRCEFVRSGTQVSNKKGERTYRVDRLVGSNSMLKKKVLKTETDMEDDVLYLDIQYPYLLRAFPLVKMDHPKKSKPDACYFYSRIDKNVVWISHTSTELADSETAAEPIREAFADIGLHL